MRKVKYAFTLWRFYIQIGPGIRIVWDRNLSHNRYQSEAWTYDPHHFLDSPGSCRNLANHRDMEECLMHLPSDRR